MHPWTLYALEVTKDRRRDANIERLLIEARATDPKPVSPPPADRPSPSPR